MDDIPEVPDFLPDDILNPDPDRMKMSDMIEMVTRGSPIITLEHVRALGGDPITKRDVEGLDLIHQAAFLHTEATLAAMLNVGAPVSDKIDPFTQAAVASSIAEHMEILVRLHRIRMREEIKTLKGESDGVW